MAYNQERHSGPSARAASGNSTAIGPLEPLLSVTAMVNVTAASGTTPTLVMTIEGSVDNTTFYTLATGAQITAVTKQVLTYNGAVPPYVRAAWTIGGTTPSFSIRVDLSFA